MSVSPFANRLAKATTCSPFEYSHTRGPVALTSMTRLLFSSAIRRSPFGRSSALFGLFSAPGPPVGPKALTRACARLTSMTRLFAWSTMRMSWFGSWIANTGTFRSPVPFPATPARPYCQTIPPFSFTTMTRLWGQVEVPVPTISVSPPASRSASFGAMTAPGPGLHRLALPDPKLQTTCFVSGFTSMTRLLNWSVIRRSPGWLNPGWRAGGMPRLMLASAERSDGFVVLGEVALPADTKLRVPVRPPGQVKKLGPFHEPPVAAARSQLAFKMWSTSAWGIGPPGPPPVRPDGHALEDGSVRPL